MHPVLIEIGRLRIYSYGFMLALSFFIGILLAARRASKRGLERELIYDLSIVLIIAAVVGSRVLYILTHSDHYRSIVDIVALWQGGATYYGGLLLALVGAIVFIRRRGISFFKVADICSPSIALGVFITRIGCYLSGCCFGSPTACLFGMTFPAHSPAGYKFADVHIHPTQLYSSLYGIVIFVILLLADRKRSFDGFTFCLLLMLYGAARFTVDFFRYYEEGAMIGGVITVSQLLSLLIVMIGFVLFIFLRGRRPAAGG